MSESVFFFVFWRERKTYNSAAPAAGFRHLCTSMTVFVNFSRWANFFERGKKVSTFLGKEFPPPRGRKKTLVSDWGAEITKIFDTVLGR